MNAIATLPTISTIVTDTNEPILLTMEEAADVMMDVSRVEITHDVPDFVVNQFWKDGKRHILICGNQGSALLLRS